MNGKREKGKLDRPPPFGEPAMQSDVAPTIGYQARLQSRAAHRLPPPGPIDETQCRTGTPDYGGLAEAQAWYRAELTAERKTDLSQRLGVPREFLCEFDLGWCEALGSVTITTVDETGHIAGIELLPLEWPPTVAPDQGPLHGMGGLIAVPDTVRRGAELVVSSDWKHLHTEWVAGINIAFQSHPTIGLGIAKSIVVRSRLVDPVGERARPAFHEPATDAPSAEICIAALRREVWHKELAAARRKLGV